MKLSLKARLRAIVGEARVLWIAARDSRTPWLAKAVAGAVAAYARSPIDLIPDFIPFIGWLDDLIILPAGTAMALRLIPPDLLAEFRAKQSNDNANR